MPDDEITPETVVETPAVETPTGPSEAEQLATLRAELAQSKAREQAYSDTFKALGNGRETAPAEPARNAYSPGGLPAEAVARLRQATGWADDDIQKHLPIFTAYFAEIAAPFLNGVLPNMADQLDYLGTRMEVPEYVDLKDEVEQERQTRIKRGEFLSRKEVTQLVKARRLSEPANLDRLIAERQAQNAQRAAAAAAATTESGTTKKIGTDAPARPLTRDALERMSSAELAKTLEGVQF